MKCQIFFFFFSGKNSEDNLHEVTNLFSGKKKKNINLSSAEFVHSMSCVLSVNNLCK